MLVDTQTVKLKGVCVATCRLEEEKDLRRSCHRDSQLEEEEEEEELSQRQST